MLGMHAARQDLETLSRPESYRVIVTGDGNFAAQDQRFGVEVMAMIGRDQVRRCIAAGRAAGLSYAVSLVSRSCCYPIQANGGQDLSPRIKPGRGRVPK